jgi:hypothetical protein
LRAVTLNERETNVCVSLTQAAPGAMAAIAIPHLAVNHRHHPVTFAVTVEAAGEATVSRYATSNESESAIVSGLRDPATVARIDGITLYALRIGLWTTILQLVSERTISFQHQDPSLVSP